MRLIFTIVNVLIIQIFLTSTVNASVGVKCHFDKGPVGFGYHVTCDGMARTWFATFDQALVQIYASERNGLVSFDWEQIQAECRVQNKPRAYCAAL